MNLVYLRIAIIFTLLILISLLCLASKSNSGDISDPCSVDQVNVSEIRMRRQAVEPYYDFLINEWSFKFWAVFQLVTIAVLLYSTFAAIYYAKWTYLRTPPSDEDIFFRKRSLEAGITRWGKG